jgi:transcriptional regulator with XRE-family HTH domain
MTTTSSLWQRLIKSKRYREEYAISTLKRMIPYQIRALRHKREWKQAQLAEHSGLTQGVISRAEDPNYGNLTLSTIGKIAGGFDLAVIIKIVPFSELMRFKNKLSEREFWQMASFEEDRQPEDVPASSEACSASSLSSDPSRQKKRPQPVEDSAALAALDQAV